MFRSKFLLMMALISVAGSAIVVTSCSLPSNHNPSFLVIAVENLGVNQVNCNRDNRTNGESGFDLLCDESVRFTHTFTPSVLSGPALASLLTAQYPAAHGLRHHGRSALSSQMTTLPELARKKSYATSFFSSGAPILRKLNLQQGFDVFDDNFAPQPKSLFRSLGQTEPLFFSWLQEIRNKNFFSVIYASDLLFEKTITTNNFGESRNQSFESQVEELDETLFSYFTRLKEINRWDNTFIILVGLNGPKSTAWNELIHTDLLSSRTQVTLLIKPPYKPRDLGLSWSLDQNVSLVDVGATLWDYIVGEAPPSQLPDLETVSLKTALTSAQTNWNEGRYVAVESAWPEWQKETRNIRFSLRREHFILIHDQRTKIYNSLIDRAETTAFSINDSSVNFWAPSAFAVLQKLNWAPWENMPLAEINRWNTLSEIFNDPNKDSRDEHLKTLVRRDSGKKSIDLNLLTYDLLAESRWSELDKWVDTDKLRSHPCVRLALLKKVDPKELKACEDPVAVEFIEWVHDETNETLRRRFFNSYYYAILDRQILETNIVLQNIWDTSNKDLYSVRMIDVLLALPQLQKFAQTTQRAMATFTAPVSY